MTKPSSNWLDVTAVTRSDGKSALTIRERALMEQLTPGHPILIDAPWLICALSLHSAGFITFTVSDSHDTTLAVMTDKGLAFMKAAIGENKAAGPESTFTSSL